MIDTVVLTLNEVDFRLTKPEKFDPDARLVLAYRGRYMKGIYDPRLDLGIYEYLPRVTLTNRIVPGGRSISLNIEFSAPALLYGNNFLELTDNDFETLIATLVDRLALLGVHTTKEVLTNAKVSKIHYGKNFIFTDYTTAYTFIQEISQANISKVLDADKSSYRNEGHSLKYQNNTFALIFYDKMKDLEKARVSPRKSVEAKSLPHGELQSRLGKRSASNPLEVLRMEVQYNKRSRIKFEMQKLGIEGHLTFRALFSQKIARQVCSSYLLEVRDKLIFSKIANQGTMIEQFMSLQKANPHVKTQFLLEYLGFQSLVEETDTRTARRIIAGDNQSQWQTMKNKYASILTANSPLQINRLIQMMDEFKLATTFDV